jgi:hypothetical protein
MAKCFHKALSIAGALLLLFPLFLLPPAAAQQAAPGLSNRMAEAPVKISGIPYKPMNRRDPFLNPLELKKTQKLEQDEELSLGLPPPGISGTYIAQAVLQGTSVRKSGRTAIVRGTDGRAYFLKEGDRLFDGYLKTIQVDSITLVRETKMRSGKTLTQDVTKRLRTP